MEGLSDIIISEVFGGDGKFDSRETVFLYGLSPDFNWKRSVGNQNPVPCL